MQSFIVLGIIPGTSFQLTFNFWLYVAIILAGMPVVRSVWRKRYVLRTYVVAFLIARLIARHQLPA
jgi:hypothetical protein